MPRPANVWCLLASSRGYRHDERQARSIQLHVDE
ncbi:hypothetical protein AVEN_144775-1, partial [Araneus ventricosus]